MRKKEMSVGLINKIKSMRKVIGLLLVTAMVFVSCKDESDPVFVNVSISGTVSSPVKDSIDMADRTYKFCITADQAAEGNVVATIGADLSLVSNYNSDKGTEYLSMVSGSYVLSGTTLTIQDGQTKSDSLTLTIEPDGFLEYGKSYLLPVEITGIEGNGVIKTTSNVIYYIFNVKDEVVELQDYGRSDWEISCSSEETSGDPGEVTHLLDGNIYSFWHSQYTGTTAEYPHWLKVDMKKEQKIRAFWIVNCQESWAASMPKDMYFEVSSDGENWTKVLEATNTTSLDKQVFQLDETVTATYFKVTFTTSISGEVYCYLGELGASYNSVE